MSQHETTASNLPTILILGPDLGAISGVTTHLNQLFHSPLAQQFHLRHFQVGSEGRKENSLGRLVRLITGPFRLAATILFGNVDTVHINTSLNARAFWRDLCYLLVAKLMNTRVVYQVHGGELPADFARRNVLPEALLRAVLRLPDVIVVLANSEVASYQDFVPGQAVQLLANAIDLQHFSTLPRPPGNPQNPLQLLYIGRLAYDKGVFDALRGLKKAREQGVSAHLTIAGSGPDESALRKMAKQMELTADVSFIGPVFGPAKRQCFAVADVLLLPSYTEGLPYALLEAMASGVPAITTRVGAIPDVVVEGVHGLFVPPGNVGAIGRAIAQLNDNRHRLERMGAACQRRVAEHYSLPRMAEEFARLYSTLHVPTAPTAQSPLPIPRE